MASVDFLQLHDVQCARGSVEEFGRLESEGDRFELAGLWYASDA